VCLSTRVFVLVWWCGVAVVGYRLQRRTEFNNSLSLRQMW
jgi:hypothetical protein